MTDRNKDYLLINYQKPPDHVTYLLARSKSRSKLNSESSDFKITIGKCLMELDKIDEVSWLLKALEFSSFLHLVFELDKRLVGPCKDVAEGYFWPEKGELVVAAGKMNSERNAFMGTFAHELAHWTMTLVFENEGLPYRPGSEEGVWYRKILGKVAEETGGLHNRFKTVFQCYEESCWEAELIVVVPHLLAQFPTESHWPTDWTKALFRFFQISVLKEIKTFVSEAPTKHNQRESIAKLNNKIGLHQLYVEHDDIKFESGFSDVPVLVIGSDHPTVTLIRVLRNFGSNQNVLCCNYQRDIMGTLSTKIFNCFNSLDECRALVIIISEDDEGEFFITDLLSFFNIVKGNRSKKLILIVSNIKFDSTKKPLEARNETSAFLKMECIKENLTVETLTAKSKNYLLEASVNFRGDYIKLEDLLSLSERPLIDGMLIEKLLLSEEIFIGKNCSQAISYDPDFILGGQLVDEHNLIRMVSNCKNRVGIAILIEAESKEWESSFPIRLQNELCRHENISSQFITTAEKLESSLQGFGGREFVPIVLVQSTADQGYTSYLRCLRQYYEYSFAYWIHVKPDKRIICTGMHCPGLTFNRKLLSYYEDSECPGIDAQQFINTEILPRDNGTRAKVVCDKAGTGKSWFLNALFGKLSDTHWVIKIILKFAKESIDALPSLDFTDEHVIKFIKYHENIDGDFAESFLKYKIRNDSKYRLLLLFDGMEEVPWTETCTLQQNKQKVALLIKYLAEETYVQTITATRPEDKVWLTNFSCRVYKFKRLGECHVYIKTICGAQAELYGKSVTPDFEDTVRNNVEIAKHLLDTPLHINMLVEIITEDIKNSVINNKVYSVATLYKEFIDIKYRDYLNDKNIPPTLRKDMTKLLKDKLQRLAVFYMFSNNDIFKDFLAASELFENKNGKLRLNTEGASTLYGIGLITKHPSLEREVQFIHQTFPEYLASELILSWIQGDTHEKLVVLGVMCNPVITFGMFNDMLKHQIVTDQQISNYAAIMEKGDILDTLKAIGSLAKMRFEHLLDLFAKCIHKSSELLKLRSSEYYYEKIQNRSMYMYPYPLLPITEFSSDHVIKTYLELRFNVNHMGPNGRTIMHNIVKRGKLELAQIMVHRWKCKLDVEDHDGITLIHEAAINGNLELIKWLHTQGLNLLKVCNRGKSAVDYAIEHDNWDVAMWVLNERPNDKKLQRNRTLLLHAVCVKGREDILRNLITGPWKDEVNKHDIKGLTPLHLAIERGHISVATLLVEAGANVMARSNDGSSSLHFAARCGDQMLIKWCLNISDYKKNHFINCSDRDQRTPLHIAAEAGHFEAVKLLIEAGADMSLKSVGEISLLHYSVISGNILLVEWVIQQAEDEEWFDVNCTTTDLKTPILLAAEQGHLEIIRDLVGAQGDVTKRSENYSSIIHYAVTSKSFEVVQWCLRNIPKELIDSRDNEGKTPIHLAAELGLQNIIQEIKEAGGDLTSLSYDGASVLHYVAVSDNPFLMKWCLETLRELGFDVNHYDKHGRTPLDIAEGKKSDRRTTKFLKDYGVQRSYQHIVETNDEGAGGSPTNSVRDILGDWKIYQPSSEENLFYTTIQRPYSRTPLDIAEGKSDRRTMKFHIGYRNQRSNQYIVETKDEGVNFQKDEEWKIYQPSSEENPSLTNSTSSSCLSTNRSLDSSQELSQNVLPAGYFLYAAVEEGNVGSVQSIVMNSINGTRDDRCYVDDEGRTPLHLAVDRRNVGIVQLIVAYSRGNYLEDYFNWKDYKGRTPLHRAVELNEYGIAQLLVLYGSSLPKEYFDLNSVDSNGKTPLQLSIENGHQDILTLLTLQLGSGAK